MTNEKELATAIREYLKGGVFNHRKRITGGWGYGTVFTKPASCFKFDDWFCFSTLDC